MICRNLRCVFHQGDWYRVLGRKRCSAMFIFISFRSASTNPLPSWFKKAECGFGILPAGSRCTVCVCVCVHRKVPRKSYWIHLCDMRWDVTVLLSPLTMFIYLNNSVSIRMLNHYFTFCSSSLVFCVSRTSRSVNLQTCGCRCTRRSLSTLIICLLRLSVFKGF